MTATLPRLATPTEVAEILKRTSKSIYRSIRAGDIPATKIGARWYVDLDRLSAKLRGEQAS
jgi:excisionase family DNA binding protein